jgi:hypothetical protein
MKRRRRPVPASDNHSLPVAQSTMARRTKNGKPFLTAQEQLPINGEWKCLSRFVVYFPGIKFLICIQLPARHRAFDERPRRALILEKLTLLQRLVARLIRHFLLAAHQPQKSGYHPAKDGAV